MLEDWRSDNCVGKYLKRLYRNRVDGNPGEKNGHGLLRRISLWKNYQISGVLSHRYFKCEGQSIWYGWFGGQYLFINFDSGVIVAINAVHDDFDTAKLVVDAVNGKIGGENWNSGVSTKPLKMRTVEEVQAIIDKVTTPLTRVSKTKYDHTVRGMKIRFKCLANYAVANGITNLPSEQEIEALTTNLEGNYYYRSHRQIAKSWYISKICGR